MSKSRTRIQQVDRLSVDKQLPGISQQSSTGASTGQDSLQHKLHTLGNEQVQRLVEPAPAIDGESKVAADVETSIRSAQGGQALDAATRNSMEAALGANFGGVRVHTDELSEQLNRSLQARAFTTGEHIFFSRGAYDPAGMTGCELLAHELTHVVQQKGGQISKRVQAKLTVSTPGDRQEQEAERVAQAVVKSHRIAPKITKAGFNNERISRTPAQKEEHTPAAKLPGSMQLWEATPDQQKFLDQVLKAHIERSSKIASAEQPDLDEKELALVKGTSESMRKDAAVAAGDLIAAANQALVVAQKKGDVDSLHTVRITASSGHRSRKYQQKVWVRNFPKYYNSTANKRAKLEGGPHGDGAIKHMVQHIKSKTAAPGYSNHQAGLAIDFRQLRTKGRAISNDTDALKVQAWCATWFYAWLQSNATTFEFVELKGEPWHWVYQPATDHSAATESQHHD